MANNAYWANVLTGGGAGALDAIDGAALADLDMAIVTTLAGTFNYSLDDDSAAAEASPNVIEPDANGGDKRWILAGISTKQGVGIGNVPAFLAQAGADQTNIALGSDITVVFGTEVYDIGGNFAGNTFTAPVTGKYLLSFCLMLKTVDTAATYYRARLVTSNRTYSILLDPNWSADLDYVPAFSLTTVTDMDAAETAYVTLKQLGGTQQTDIGGDPTTVNSFFSGVLVG